ncbi:MAG: response regulator transcription factor [Pleurocapsa sp. MO_192.B19]|nr:response regulator transcription factor [Pleurocapsa sp. MO_192.B19]
MQSLFNSFTFLISAIAMTSRKISVAIADDYPLVRNGLILMIRNQPDFKLVGEASNGLAAVELYRQQHPDVILMDTCMPQMDGVEAIAVICQEFPEARIIALSECGYDEDLYLSLQAGAKGYLRQDSSLDTVVNAIRQVDSGRQYLLPELATRLTELTNLPRLSEREVEVLALVARGRTNPQIGESLNISLNTVKFHVNNISIKLNASDRTSAVVIAIKQGILKPESVL